MQIPNFPKLNPSTEVGLISLLIAQLAQNRLFNVITRQFDSTTSIIFTSSCHSVISVNEIRKSLVMSLVLSSYIVLINVERYRDLHAYGHG